MLKALRRLRVLTVGIVLLMVGALAGCSDHPGQAAVGTYTDLSGNVQTVSVSETELDAVSQELASAQLGRSDVLDRLLSVPIYTELAEKYGITASDADSQTILENSNLGKHDFSTGAKQVASLYVISAKLDGLSATQQEQLQADYAALAGSYAVTLAPRYDDARPWEIQDDSSSVAQLSVDK